MHFTASVPILSLIAISALGRSFVRRDAAAIETGISFINSNITKWVTDMNTFNMSSTPANANAILSDAGDLDTAVQGATTAALATHSLTEEEGNRMFIASQGFESGIVPALTVLSRVASIPLVSDAVSAIYVRFMRLDNALIAIMPADLVPATQKIAANIDNAFAAAIAALASDKAFSMDAGL